MATEASRSSADSYIGSLISLTSKSEIRYEGILYNINTEESSIGLRNVRSFGTEGRKKDGPQLMPSDKVYEYILFRGSDIKDLQVKSSSPVPAAQPTQPINSDPAIIQSHYPRPPQQSPTLPPAANNSLPDPNNNQNPQMGHPGSTMQGGPPLYQPGGNLGSWGPMPPPPNANSSGHPMPPMYWPGFYAPPNGLPQLHQQSMLRPPSPSLQQPMQYPNYNPSLPGGPPVPPPEYPPAVSTTDNLPSFMQNNPLNSVGPTAPLIGSFQSLSLSNTSDVNSTVLPVSNKPSVPSELPTPSLVTPGQLLQSVGPTSQFTQAVHKDVEVVQMSQTPTPAPAAPVSEPSVPIVAPVPTEAQPPILPLPPQQRMAPKTNGAPYQNRQSYNYRGRERGRGGYGGSRSVMKFTEEFDFTAMNEKFNKDEIWGTLGKTNKKENDGNVSDEDEYEDQNEAADLPEVDVKPVYSKDDFFDTLSCNSLDKQSSNGRPRFSEQMKLDTETFGEFSRYRGGRGGRGPYRGGRARGGGGYYGRGGGYYGRGRGGGGGGRTSNATRDY